MEKGYSELWINDVEFLPLIKYFLQCKGNDAIQLEAAWILTNIAAGSTTQTKMVSF